jgi:hypothetical protein
VPSLSADSLQFRAALMPTATNALLAQGTTTTTPTLFGDGVRCVGGSQIRLGVVTASGGVSTWPPTGSSSISLLGQVTTPGSTRYYYAYFRDGATFCTPALFNVTDAQRIDWAP